MDECRIGRQRRARVSFNVTPMIDCTFQLIIFFLLGCQFRVSEGRIRAKLPDVGSGRTLTPPVLDVIRVTLRPGAGDGQGAIIEISGAQAPLNGILDLYDRLKRRIELCGAGADMVPVVIRPEGGVRWEHVVDAFHQGVRAGYKKIGLAPAAS